MRASSQRPRSSYAGLTAYPSIFVKLFTTVDGLPGQAWSSAAMTSEAHRVRDTVNHASAASSPPPPDSLSPTPAAAASAGSHAAPSPTARSHRRWRGCGRRNRRSARRRFAPSATRGATGRRPPPLGQDIGRAHVSEIMHQREGAVVAHHHAIDVGDRQRKARALQQAPTSRRSANGATRGDTPPSHSASAAAKHCRSSVSVSPPIIAASNSPSGRSARRICVSTPGRSLTN